MVFGCISKNFPENIFWCLEEKKENTNPEKHKQIKASSFKYFYRKCIKSGKRNQNPAKENESLTSDDRCDRGATSDNRCDERCDEHRLSAAHRSSIAPLVDRRARSMRSRGAVVARRSSHRDRTGRRSSLIHFLLLGFGFFCLI